MAENTWPEVAEERAMLRLERAARQYCKEMGYNPDRVMSGRPYWRFVATDIQKASAMARAVALYNAEEG